MKELKFYLPKHKIGTFKEKLIEIVKSRNFPMKGMSDKEINQNLITLIQGHIVTHKTGDTKTIVIRDSSSPPKFGES